MGLPNDFYTTSTLFTLSGSSMAILIITSVLDDLFGRRIKKMPKKWISLGLSFLFSLFSATLLAEKNLLIWIVAIVNGFLIYLTSVGMNTIISKGNSHTSSSIRKTSANRSKSNFFERLTESWW